MTLITITLKLLPVSSLLRKLAPAANANALFSYWVDNIVLSPPQLTLYAQKFDEFQGTLAKSNQIYARFKKEMDNVGAGELSHHR